MADGGFDPCECVWNHEHAMQRLISLVDTSSGQVHVQLFPQIRNSQGYCTDTECFQEMPGPQGMPSGSSEITLMFFVLGWLLMSVLLYFLRPNSLRGSTSVKPSDQGPNYQPPPNSPVH